MTVAYRIPDEPLDGGTRGWGIEPFWPLLAVMLAGAWLSAGLFAINAWFLRGPTWGREIALAAAMLAGTVVLVFAIDAAYASGTLSQPALKYALLVVVVWKLALAYWIFFLQQTGFALYEYFGGRGQSGLLVVIVGALLKSYVITAVNHPLWQIVVS